MRFLRSIAAALLVCSAALPSVAAEPADSVAEAVGTVFGTYVRSSLNDLRTLGVEVNHDAFMDALGRAIKGEPAMFADPADANAYLTLHIDSRRPMARVDTLSVESQQAYVDSMAALPGAVTTPSGLVFIEEKAGVGAHPVDSDEVEVMYLGRFYDGIQFDYTDRPITFKVGELTPGFAEGLRLMRPGGQYRLVIPAALAYGTEGIPGAIPGNAALDFIVDLISINPKK